MKYFSISELTRSFTAEREGIDNTPTEAARQNLVALIENVLDQARRDFGDVVIVSSGYRCPVLNTLVGGATTSQHKRGEAADLVTKHGRRGNLNLAKTIARNGVYDQLILESVTAGTLLPEWVHVSSRMDVTLNRGQILVKKAGSVSYRVISLGELLNA